MPREVQGRIQILVDEVAMIGAAELAKGMVVRVEGQIYRVLEVDARAAAAKLAGVVKAELSNVNTGRLWQARFRPQERLEELEITRRNLEFLFRDGENCTFMDASTFEQVEVPSAVVGSAAEFLQSGAAVPVEFSEGKPITAVLPEIVEARVVRTAPPSHSPQDTAWKEATLENGVSIHVPLFIAQDERVRVDLRTGRYVERVHNGRKRVA